MGGSLTHSFAIINNVKQLVTYTMKRTLVILFSSLLMVTSCSNKLYDNSRLHDLYELSYKYIVENGTGNKEDYLISDRMYNLDMWMFSDSLKDLPGKREVLDSLVERNKYMFDIKSSKNHLSYISKQATSPKYVVFYSKVHDDMIVANVFPIDSKIHSKEDYNNYAKMSVFTVSKDYLFVFSNNNLVKTVTQEMISN